MTVLSDLFTLSDLIVVGSEMPAIDSDMIALEPNPTPELLSSNLIVFP
jgi:hypothetical protein